MIRSAPVKRYFETRQISAAFGGTAEVLAPDGNQAPLGPDDVNIRSPDLRKIVISKLHLYCM